MVSDNVSYGLNDDDRMQERCQHATTTPISHPSDNDDDDGDFGVPPARRRDRISKIEWCLGPSMSSDNLVLVARRQSKIHVKVTTF